MKTNFSKNNIALISIYYGNQPKYLSLFLSSAKLNSNFDFHIFSEWEELPIKASNIKLHKLSFLEFNKLALDKKIITKNIQNPYKLCDLKPAWPLILDHYFKLNRYDYIGYTDIDLIFGDIESFVTKDLIQKPDIWTLHSEYMAGSFLLLKNNFQNKTLFKYKDYYKLIFDSQNHYAFDEKFLPKYENISFKGNPIYSFTDIVNHLEKKGVISTIRKHDILFESRPEKLVFKNGHLFDNNSKELFGFHFLLAKRYILWTYPSWIELPKQFYINKYGFYIKRPISFISLFTRTNNYIQIFSKLSNINYKYILKNNSLSTLLKSLKKQLFD